MLSCILILWIYSILLADTIGVLVIRYYNANSIYSEHCLELVNIWHTILRLYRVY